MVQLDVRVARGLNIRSTQGQVYYKKNKKKMRKNHTGTKYFSYFLLGPLFPPKKTNIGHLFHQHCEYFRSKRITYTLIFNFFIK